MNVSGFLPSGRTQFSCFCFFNIKKQFKGKIGHFIGFILKLLTKLKKLIHIELMIFFLRKEVIYSCQADDHFSLVCTYCSPLSHYFTQQKNGIWSAWLQFHTAYTEVHSPGGKTHLIIDCVFARASDMHKLPLIVWSLTGSLQALRIQGLSLLASYLPWQFHLWQTECLKM